MLSIDGTHNPASAIVSKHGGRNPNASKVPSDQRMETGTGSVSGLVAAKSYVDENFVDKHGNVEMVGDLNMNSNKVTNLGHPDNDRDAVSKSYVLENFLKLHGTNNVPGTRFQELVVTDDQNYEWSDCKKIPTNFTENDFEAIPAGLYACYTGYLPPTRRGILPANTKGYLLTMTYQQPVHRNKLYKYTTIQGEEYTARYSNGNWISWQAKAIKSYMGIIPEVHDMQHKSGFIITASSELSRSFAAENVSIQSHFEWAVAAGVRHFWICVTCPEPIRAWRIGLRGRYSNTDRIHKWFVEGSHDKSIWHPLYRTVNPTYLGFEEGVQFFELETPEKYRHYRLVSVEAEGTNPGLSFLQLYAYLD